ncbi:hypothetical protein NHX12_018455 [Muraenolepis orangiensis]|uniref:Uncharacterized protein n=1 Tax=Muraenolepis orangiensis TaxID=630683 RepID=A0A9Q0EWK4_9TELE|nr:hypothetical protein NHX12_018455 [Muraenolepis orangiensis]
MSLSRDPSSLPELATETLAETQTLTRAHYRSLGRDPSSQPESWQRPKLTTGALAETQAHYGILGRDPGPLLEPWERPKLTTGAFAAH